MKEAHRQEKSELNSRKTSVENKFKKALARIHLYEETFEQNPGAKPKNYRKCRLTLEDGNNEEDQGGGRGGHYRLFMVSII